jgi:hypothetical protein
MSKTISIVNAGNVYAQTFLKSLSGYNKIILGDCVNSRHSVSLFSYYILTYFLNIFYKLNKFEYYDEKLIFLVFKNSQRR